MDPRFRETLGEDADVEFYRALAALVDDLVSLDAERFDVEPRVFEETPPAPLESFTRDDGDTDFRIGSCGATPSPEANQPEMPMGDRQGPY